jgi:hypothetical protein
MATMDFSLRLREFQLSTLLFLLECFHPKMTIDVVPHRSMTMVHFDSSSFKSFKLLMAIFRGRSADTCPQKTDDSDEL